ncbi:MAG: hypothetical protein H6709_00325 [Kofleriaceae bacterium]|nr:hypothetical protein [Kofleriaceae bacterium]MCB9570512.1 hypothetical protein [Kofleriaceae bacterium]
MVTVILAIGAVFWGGAGFATAWRELGKPTPRPALAWLDRQRADRPWLLPAVAVGGAATALYVARTLVHQLARRDGVIGGPIVIGFVAGALAAGTALGVLARRRG